MKNEDECGGTPQFSGHTRFDSKVGHVSAERAAEADLGARRRVHALERAHCRAGARGQLGRLLLGHVVARHLPLVARLAKVLQTQRAVRARGVQDEKTVRNGFDE